MPRDRYVEPDELDYLTGNRVAVELFVQPVECLQRLREKLRRHLPAGHWNVLLVVLPPVAHADRTLDLRLSGVPLAAHLVECGVSHGLEVLTDRPGVDGLRTEMLAPDLSDLWLGNERPECR